MGLDFSHCDAHWSYSGFHRFRERLANAIGINLNDMVGFGYDFVMLKNTGKEIPWDTVKDDIVPLLNHSDCDGILTPEECAKVAPRLKELVAGWDDDDYDKQHAMHLVEGMELCVKLNEPLLFH